MDEQFAEDYEDFSKWHWWFKGRKKVVKYFLNKHFRTSGKDRILSIGTGRFERELFSDCRFYSLNKERDSYAENTVKTENGITGMLPNIPFESKSFDLVCVLDVLEHVEDDQKSLRELSRVLKSNGLLLITVPAFSFLWSEHDDINNHYRRYNRTQLCQKTESTLLETLDWSYFNTFLFPIIVGVRLLQKYLPIMNRTESSFEMNQPGVINELLAGIFRSEALLLRYLKFPFGSSLLMVMRNSKLEY